MNRVQAVFFIGVGAVFRFFGGGDLAKKWGGLDILLVIGRLLLARFASLSSLRSDDNPFPKVRPIRHRPPRQLMLQIRVPLSRSTVHFLHQSRVSHKELCGGWCLHYRRRRLHKEATNRARGDQEGGREIEREVGRYGTAFERLSDPSFSPSRKRNQSTHSNGPALPARYPSWFPGTPGYRGCEDK